MRILLLAPHPFLTPRGTPLAVQALVEELAAAGHTIDVVTYFQGDDVVARGVRVHRIRRPPLVRRVPIGPSWQKVPCDLLLLAEAARRLRAARYDVIHAVEEAAFLAVALRRRSGVPFVFDMDSLMSQQVRDLGAAFRPAARAFEWLERAAIRRAAGVLAVCPALVDYARAHGAVGPVACLPDLPMGAPVSTNVGPPSDAAHRIRAVGGIRIVYVGNLEVYQGVELLLDAFSLAADELPDCRLAVVGGDPPAIAALADRTQRLGIAERVDLLGSRPPSELAAILEAADILASPRLRGINTPMKVYSYMQAGKPILATDLPTHTQLLDASTALLVDPTPAAMAAGLRRLAADPELRSRLGAAARRLVETEYSRDRFRQRLLAFYDDVASELRGGTAPPRTERSGRIHAPAGS